ncbi:ankyrin repeat domain-containing protein [Gloeobacter violaceus]|uniref:Glr2887 protein n=1 Tax=Gloeobacter violaceus (strain ATCC 29082 / PCC 7421) TaxID=251221 RepID=Q7NCT9_GLOVI|nr:ankyrin repeat domain-containing protein [Gloeobacter violaceus]BAC90828.1 glr2887 [Gloeobacter violaceus PCC 7421]
MKYALGLLLPLFFCTVAAAQPIDSSGEFPGGEAYRPCAWLAESLPLQVFIDPIPKSAAEREGEYLQTLLDAIKAWNDVGVGGKPVFEQTRDRADADVAVAWQFEPNTTASGFMQVQMRSGGRSYGVCVRSRITLILQHWRRRQIPTGLLGFFLPVPIPNFTTENLELRSADELRVIATHELGHALGLPHSTDTGDVMYPFEGQKFLYYGIEFTNVQVLTEKSRRTLAAFYDDAWLDFRLAQIERPIHTRSGTADTPPAAAPMLSRAATGRGRPLVEAAAAGRLPEAERLLAGGLEIDARDESGWTPLIAAAASGREQMVAFLIQKGADVNARDTSGYTALSHARAGRFTRIVELLTRAGARN